MKDRDYRMYNSYFREIVSEIDERVSLYSEKDFKGIVISAKRRELRKKRSLLVAAIFSIFVVSSSVLGGVSYYNSLKTKEIIAESTSELVDSIFDKPFMPDVEYSYINERQSISDWLTNLDHNNFSFGGEESLNF